MPVCTRYRHQATGLVNPRNAQFGFPYVFDSLLPGLMAYWSVEKRDITPLVITPTLHYSNLSRRSHTSVWRRGILRN